MGADAGTVVEQVELVAERAGLGRSGLLGEPGKKGADLDAIVVGRLFDAAPGGRLGAG